jgi:hypothetical protein
VALFSVYEAHRNELFSELMWTIAALYQALPARLPTADACAILAATRHSCGHGGVEEPIALALRAFGDDPYTPELFNALRKYRLELAKLRSAEAARALGEIAFVLWEDVREPLKPRSCMSSGIRVGISSLPDARRAAWSRLLRHIDRTAKRRPDTRWIKEARGALDAAGPEAFADEVRTWLHPSAGTGALSTGGRHVLKTVIWYATLSGSDALDDTLPPLIDVTYAKPEAAVHLIYAVGYWLESRPLAFAEPHRERLRAKWPIAGARVRD